MRPYQTRSAEVVKSVRQRWMLLYWIRLRGERALPLWPELDMAEFDSCFDDLTILDVLGDNGTPRFRIHDHGKNVGAMFAGQCAGKLLADTLPETTRASTLETYEQTVRSRMPVFTLSQVTDAEGRQVLYERLLLPFSDFGERVYRIIGFLETISHDGSFARRDLLTKTGAATRFSVKAVLHTNPR